MALTMKASAVARVQRAQRQRAQRTAPVAAAQAAPEPAATRRAALALVAGTATAGAAVKPAAAAYGEGANVFGKATNTSGFVPYAGDGYALLIPSKYNPSQEKEYPGVDANFEDNFDAVCKVTVLVNPTSKGKIEDYGSPQEYLKSISYLLGAQSWQGDSLSEGGFKRGKTSIANVLDVGTVSKNGKTYYQYEILTRTADGDEGGRHHLIASTVSNGALYTVRIQDGDKRWFKGHERDCRKSFESFQVA